MKFQVEIDGRSVNVELGRNADGSSVATVDGREYEVEISRPEPGVILLKSAGRVLEMAVSRDATGGGFTVDSGNFSFPVTVRDPKKLRSGGDLSEDSSGRVEIRTAMPGKIVRILVSQGDSVKKGDPVIVVEAMKMQNEMRSPRDGTVSEIRVSKNDTVGAGETLASIE